MRKLRLSLESLQIQEDRVLSREELKRLVGGSTAETQCGSEGKSCPNGQCCSAYGYCGTGPVYCACDGANGSGNCAYMAPGEGNWSFGYSAECAQQIASALGGAWCCSSC
ncbi:hypothetical protein F3J22_29105 [Chitinophaga sp. Cy-1792]|nr:hypothetical protein [Chitinophaga sp. Cy-1792]